MPRLIERIALITGAGTGIGRAAARAMRSRPALSETMLAIQARSSHAIGEESVGNASIGCLPNVNFAKKILATNGH